MAVLLFSLVFLFFIFVLYFVMGLIIMSLYWIIEKIDDYIEHIGGDRKWK